MANYQYVESTGVIVPDTEEILSDVQNEYLTTFGSEMSTDASTPQGVLITSDTVTRAEVVQNNAALANQINPNIAGGIFLDAVGALTGLERDAATRSTIDDVAITGVASTIIPEGSQAKSGDNLFETTGTVIIALDGTATANFRSVAYGAIPAPANTLTTIVSNVLGWETVTNANAAELGSDNQSDPAFRSLRNNTLALQGISLPEAITSALYATEGVKSLKFRENVKPTTQVIDGISLVAHSIWACVDGGTDSDIGQALLQNKSGGCGYNGAVTVNVVEASSGQTYVVKFDRPDEVRIYVRVTARVGTSIVDPETAIDNALLAYANNKIDGETGFVVGQSVSPFELSAAVNSQVAGVYVKLLEVSIDGASWQTTEISLDLDEIATLDVDDITVVLL